MEIYLNRKNGNLTKLSFGQHQWIGGFHAYNDALCRTFFVYRPRIQERRGFLTKPREGRIADLPLTHRGAGWRTRLESASSRLAQLQLEPVPDFDERARQLGH